MPKLVRIKVKISATIDEELDKKIDELRDNIKYSTFINMMIWKGVRAEEAERNANT